MDMLTAYDEAVNRNQERIEAVRPDQLGNPTPCTDWDVATLIGHIIGGCQMFAAALGQPKPSADRSSPSAASDLGAAHRVAGQAAVSAFASPGAMQRSLALPIGEVPGRVALGLALTDAVVHG
jgi:uncharacterized protein (TIGR03086 family)